MKEGIGKRLFSLGGGAKKAADPKLLLRGRTHNVIVIKPKNDMFTQAIFIMRDDYFSASSLPEDELLRKAQEAAGVYIPPLSALSRRENTAIAVLSFLLAAETLGLLFLLL